MLHTRCCLYCSWLRLPGLINSGFFRVLRLVAWEYKRLRWFLLILVGRINWDFARLFFVEPLFLHQRLSRFGFDIR